MMEKNTTVKTVEGKLEKPNIKEAKNLAAGLVIIGREQKNEEH